MKNLNNKVEQDSIVPNVTDLEIKYDLYDQFQQKKNVKIIEFAKRFISSNIFTYTVIFHFSILKNKTSNAI
jgi:hypothetical protein